MTEVRVPHPPKTLPTGRGTAAVAKPSPVP